MCGNTYLIETRPTPEVNPADPDAGYNIVQHQHTIARAIGSPLFWVEKRRKDVNQTFNLCLLRNLQEKLNVFLSQENILPCTLPEHVHPPTVAKVDTRGTGLQMHTVAPPGCTGTHAALASDETERSTSG